MTRYIDSNALLRLILNDVPDQYEEVRKLLFVASANDVIVLESVVEEVCFVLEFHAPYKMPRRVIYNLLSRLFSEPSLNVSKDIKDALRVYGNSSKLDLVDCLLAVKAGMKKRGVITFDKDLLKILV